MAVQGSLCVRGRNVDGLPTEEEVPDTIADLGR